MKLSEEIKNLNIHKTLGHLKTDDPLRWEEINHPISTPKSNAISQASLPGQQSYSPPS